MKDKIYKNYEDWNTEFNCIDTYCGINRVSITEITKEAWNARNAEIKQIKEISDGLLSENEKMLTEIQELRNSINSLETSTEVACKRHNDTMIQNHAQLTEIQELKDKIEKLKNALGFYADYSNYDCLIDEKEWRLLINDISKVQISTDPINISGVYGGKLARQTLKELGELK